MTRTAPSWRAALRSLAAKVRGLSVGLAIGGALSVAWLNASPTPAPVPALGKPVAIGSPQQLIEDHGCWSGAAPADMAGRIPGHVVATKPDATHPIRAGSALVDLALRQVFEGEDHGLAVHAFCR